MAKRIQKRRLPEVPEIRKHDSVYVGLDVHKVSIHAAIRLNGEELLTAVLPARVSAMVKFLEPYRIGLRRVVYEAGPTGYGLARGLKEHGIPLDVIAPSKVPRPTVQGSKSDQLDCRKLAVLAEKELLQAVAIPTAEEEAERDLQRAREYFVDRRRKIKQKIKSFLLFHGFRQPNGLETWNLPAVQALRKIPMLSALRFSLDRLLEDYIHVLDEIKQIQERLKSIIEERHGEEAERLRTHPGVGPVTITQVVTELYQPARFDNARQVTAYVGLAPMVRQSGNSRIEGPLAKGGRAALRATLVEAAWAWIRRDKGARKIYGRLVRNTGSAKKAIVAMARRMLVNLWLMLVRKENYRPQWA